MKKLLLISLLTILFVACTDKDDDVVPDVSFDAMIDPTSPEYVIQDNPFIVLPDALNRRIGVAGIVVFSVTSEEFYAFDLMCTNSDHDDIVLVGIEKPGSITMVCPECKSEFNVASEFGSVTKGPAKWPLKRYSTDKRGDYLHIWN